MIVTVLIGWIVGFFKKEITETWQVMMIGLTQFVLMNGLRVAVFYLIFQEELVHTKNLFFEIF